MEAMEAQVSHCQLSMAKVTPCVCQKERDSHTRDPGRREGARSQLQKTKGRKSGFGGWGMLVWVSYKQHWLNYLVK